MSGTLTLSLSGTTPGQRTTDTVPIAPFAQVAISDPIVGAVETLTVTVSAPANGVLTNLGGGAYDPATGVYSDTGTAAAVTAALDGLVFVPVTPTASAAQTATTTFTIDVSDSVSSPVSDSATTVVVTIPPTATIATDGPTSLVAVGNQFLLDPSGTVTAGNNGPLLRYNGVPVTVGEFGAWTPIGAIRKLSGTYLVAWKLAGSNQYQVWTTDSAGNFTAAAIGPVAGSAYALESAEAVFGQDLNGDGTVGLASRTVATDQGTALTQIADRFALDASGGSGPWLRYGGALVTAGEFGGWTPIGAVQQGAGYLVAWALAGADAYQVWTTDSAGNFTGLAVAAAPGTNLAVQEAETQFGQDLNGDRTVGPAAAAATIRTDNGISLVQIGNDFALRNGSGAGPALQFEGAPVTAGEFGAWKPIGATPQGAGYLVAWQYGSSSLYEGWNTDANGNFTGIAAGPGPGIAYALESGETLFGQDLNGDGTIGLKSTVIATYKGTKLTQVADRFALDASGGTGPWLQYGGSPVTAGEFAAWAPISATSSGSGYLVAWQNGTADQFQIWTADSSGNFTGVAVTTTAGSSFILEQFETLFDFDNDPADDRQVWASGTQVTISTDAGLSLKQINTNYVMRNASGVGPALQYGGKAVAAGIFGAWRPIGAVAAPMGNGYLVAWEYGTASQYQVWTTDTSGRFTGLAVPAVAGSGFALAEIETVFGQDLNSDQRIGPPSTVSAIRTDSGTNLVQIGANFALRNAGGSGPALQYLGAPVTAGMFGAWKPIGAVANAQGGYLVAWQNASASQYQVWTTDDAGNFTGVALGSVAGTSVALESFESTFGQDLNGDGTVGLLSTVIATDNGTALTQVGNRFALDASGGSGPWLQYGSATVTSGEFGAWQPIGAVGAQGGGYLVAWQLGTTSQYQVWTTDAAGRFSGLAVPSVPGSSFALAEIETSFGQDLNNDSTIGPKPTSTTIRADNGTSLVQIGANFALRNAAGVGPALQYNDVAVSAGMFGAWAPIGAVANPQGSGYLVAWQNGTGDQYQVWSTSGSGAFTGVSVGPMAGVSFALQDLEPTFQQDLNGDARLSAALYTSTTGGTLDLTGQTQSATIHLGSNFASAILSPISQTAPAMSFVGAPQAILLGASASDTLEYGLSPYSGIETVANFTLGQDELNVDMLGAATGLLHVYDATVGGQHAIAIGSIADIAHGVVLLGLPSSTTAADIVANHLTFDHGHAIIT